MPYKVDGKRLLVKRGGRWVQHSKHKTRQSAFFLKEKLENAETLRRRRRR